MPTRTRRGRKRAAELLPDEGADENAAQNCEAATFDRTYVHEELQDLEHQGR